MIGARFDLAMAEAWPAAETEKHGKWLFRFTEGVTRRANSVLCVGQPAEVQSAIAAAEDFYAQRDLPTVFMVSDALTPPAVRETLAAHGYREDAATWIVHRDLPATSTLGVGQVHWRMEVTDEPSDQWFDTFWAVEGDRHGSAAAAVYRNRLLQPSWPTRFVTVTGADEHAPSSVGQVVVVDDIACLQCLATAPIGRRRGAGTASVAQRLAVAAELGAKTAFAAVMADNAASLGLLERLGFQQSHQYRYMRRQSPSA